MVFVKEDVVIGKVKLNFAVPGEVGSVLRVFEDVLKGEVVVLFEEAGEVLVERVFFIERQVFKEVVEEFLGKGVVEEIVDK